ncbi:hypothetical protein Drorol1_Dr00005936 [Drosera rotundifolia]
MNSFRISDPTQPKSHYNPTTNKPRAQISTLVSFILSHPKTLTLNPPNLPSNFTFHTMVKKKFIEKKKSATFQLIARDTSDPNYGSGPENDRVFIRVDNNPVSFPGLEDSTHDHHNNDHNYNSHDGFGGFDELDSRFGDADEDGEGFEEGYDDGFGGRGIRDDRARSRAGGLPESVRREILDLGLPDDGYNYLIHMREIKNSGGGSFYYENPKAPMPGQLPLDVKAYDATKVRLSDAKAELNDETAYAVAERTVNVRVQKVLDPEVVALLEDDESRFGSDVEVLEDDFVLKGNLPEEGDEDDDFDVSEEFHQSFASAMSTRHDNGVDHEVLDEENFVDEKPRVRRLVDEQFDLLELQEYGTDYDDDYNRSVVEEDKSLASKLNDALKIHKASTVELDDNYRAPKELLSGEHGPEDEEAVAVLRKCLEYAEKYQNADEDEQEHVIMEESSDESEVWDCETIVSTYSNLDNHPARIGAPETFRKKKLSETVFKTLKDSKENMILLGGKEKIPVEYLPQGRRATKEKVKDVAKNAQPKRKPHGQESKEEKKERKAAVKEERREARRVKKEVKELYRGEAKHAQKVFMYGE